MKAHLPVCILITILLCTACATSREILTNPTNNDPTADACHIDPQGCATLTPAPELSPTATPPTLPTPEIHEKPGPIFDTVIQIPIGEGGILYCGAGVEDMEPVGPNGLVVTPDGVFIIGDVYGNRLMRYDAEGNRLDDIDLTSLGILNISDLVGTEDALYILEISFKVLPERYRINQLTTSGKLVRQYDLPKGYHLEDGLYGLAIGYSADGAAQLLVQSGASAGSLYYRIPDSDEKPPEELPAFPVFGKPLRRVDADPGELAVLAIDTQGFESRMTAGGTIGLLFARADGSLYLQREDIVTWDPFITTDLTLHYVSADGEPLSVARYPLMDWYFHLWRYLSVGPDGNVYALITREKSVDILKLNFYPALQPIQLGATEPTISRSSNASLEQPEVDCSKVEDLSPDSPEAQRIIQEMLDNFYKDWPTEYMGFEQVWTMNKLGKYAVIQGMVTTEEVDVLLLRQTERGYVLSGLFPPSQTQPDEKRAEIAAYFGERVPDAPPELFYCLSFSKFIGEPISPGATSTSQPENNALIISNSYPGDGGGCMADYLGYMAPSFILYADGHLLIENPYGNPFWYTEYYLDQKAITDLLTQIENSGFFSVDGDGSEYEHDSIYQLPLDVEVTHGAGTYSLEVNDGDLSKRVTIYIPYMDYLVPEIFKALDIVDNFKPNNGKPYHPTYWIAWIGKEDPCDPYMLDFLPWPDDLPTPTGDLNGSGESQFIMQSNKENNLLQLLGARPGTYIYEKDGNKYYIYTRPLLPDEMPSDF